MWKTDESAFFFASSPGEGRVSFQKHTKKTFEIITKLRFGKWILTLMKSTLSIPDKKLQMIFRLLLLFLKISIFMWKNGPLRVFLEWNPLSSESHLTPSLYFISLTHKTSFANKAASFSSRIVTPAGRGILHQGRNCTLLSNCTTAERNCTLHCSRHFHSPPLFIPTLPPPQISTDSGSAAACWHCVVGTEGDVPTEL